MQLTLVNVLLLFTAFCLIQFAFNMLWKVIDIKLSVIGTQKQLDQVYTFICRKLFSRKEEGTISND